MNKLATAELIMIYVSTMVNVTNSTTKLWNVTVLTGSMEGFVSIRAHVTKTSVCVEVESVFSSKV